ncbi:hypothetical protein GCM10023317_62560 [Actinopolymorpha pittospori]
MIGACFWLADPGYPAAPTPAYPHAVRDGRRDLDHTDEGRNGQIRLPKDPFYAGPAPAFGGVAQYVCDMVGGVPSRIRDSGASGITRHLV